MSQRIQRDLIDMLDAGSIDLGKLETILGDVKNLSIANADKLASQG